ncbi:hypothetical protein lerEdw1_006273 [Lerista edwardsae]|nr:hypothetical protein lerEdw1_006273 [Lerista edwardsae]
MTQCRNLNVGTDNPMVTEEKGPCYRFVSAGKQCMHPLSVQLSKQLCCCSVGKAWGPHCEKCPLPGTAAFKEICPGGMGYTVSGSHRNKLYHHPAVRVQPPVIGKTQITQPVAKGTSPPPLPAKEEPVEALTISQKSEPEVAVREVGTSAPDQELVDDQGKAIIQPGQPQLSPGISTINLHPQFPVVEKTSPPVPVEVGPDTSTSSANQVMAPTQVSDVDECARPHTCGEGLCVNTIGSYKCEYCDSGFQMNRRGQCEDIDECSLAHTCPDTECINTPGSYKCVPCQDGFRGWKGKCHDINECQYSSLCTNGLCENLEGSFRCLCSQGYQLSPAGDQCEDVDECQEQQLCKDGQCRNIAGSYRCICGQGFQLSPSRDQCEDINECQEENDICRGGNCINTEGSYDCTCPDGFQSIPLRGCQDIDECANNTWCGSHGFCENSPGSFRCLCYQGYQYLQDGQGCVDVNECEMLSGICGEALCENVEGSFLCLCSDENQEFDSMTGQCRFHSSPDMPEDTKEPADEKKECYYNLNDANFCDNVLTSNVTKQECCCTLGAGWGDNCEIFPCPVLGSAEFTELCPQGKGFIPSEDPSYGVVAQNYKDADECQLFGQEICKNGFCLNTQPGYECYCKQGTYYDPVKLQCFEDYAQLCNIPVPGSRRPYGQDGLVDFEEEQYTPETDPYFMEDRFLNSFEELQAEECGILNGCENGRCVRVQEGYTCDCFDGYSLDMTKMTCVDVNECNELNNRMSLCKNAKCINTEGSYKCVCLPGYVPSDKPNYCTPLNSDADSELE